MRQSDFERMDLDRLWELHVEISDVLKDKIGSERQRLVDRLKYLQRPTSERRPYPPVLPKYRNPDHPSETWAGRGKQPRWLTAQLKSGSSMDDFRV
jgi:DNA-binding protein H-NS